MLTSNLTKLTTLPAGCHFAIDSRVINGVLVDYGFVVWRNTRQGNVTIEKRFGYTSYEDAKIELANWILQF